MESRGLLRALLPGLIARGLGMMGDLAIVALTRRR